MSIRAGWSSYHRLLAVAVGLACTAVIAIGLTILWLRFDSIRDAYNDSTDLAIVLSEQLNNSIRTIDRALTEIRDQETTRDVQIQNYFGYALGDESTYRRLIERLSRMEDAEFIGIVNKNGKLVNSTQQWPTPKNDVSRSAQLPTLQKQ